MCVSLLALSLYGTTMHYAVFYHELYIIKKKNILLHSVLNSKLRFMVNSCCMLRDVVEQTFIWKVECCL